MQQNAVSIVFHFLICCKRQQRSSKPRKRANVWMKQLGERIVTEKTIRLKLIGETRWSGKSNALRGIFGTYENPRVNSFLDLLICLFTISTSQTFELAVGEEAQALINAFLQFQTILSTFIFLRIFEETVPLSEYLQTKGLDMVEAWNTVQIASTDLKRKSREIGEIHTAAKSCAEKVNEQLEEMAKFPREH